MTQDTNTSPIRAILTKALFVVGIIFLIVIIGFALLFIVPRIVGGIGGAASALTSIFRNAAGDGISVGASNTRINSGDSVTLTWEDTTEATAATSYALSFSCEDNVAVRVDGKRAQCEKNVDVSFADGEIEVDVQNSTKDSVADVAFKIAAIESGDELRSGRVAVAVVNGNPVATQSDDSNDSNDSSNSTDDDADTIPGRVTALPPLEGGSTIKVNGGKANLAFGQVVTGYWVEGVVFPADRVRDGQIGGAQFTVVNDGGAATGPWSFTYTEPTNRSDVRSAGIQPSIPAGGSLTYVITFPAYAEGMRTTTITLDAGNSVAERSEADNSRVEVLLFDEASSGQSGSDGSYNRNDDANLTVSILGTGRLDGRRFVETDNVDSRDELAIRFLVKNDGGESTGRWRFTVTMSGDDRQDFESAMQPSLSPGQSAEFVLGFDEVDRDADSVTFKVEVDSDDDVDEEDERDNTDSERVRL